MRIAILAVVVSGAPLLFQQGLGTLTAYAAIGPQVDPQAGSQAGPVHSQSSIDNTERPPSPQRVARIEPAKATAAEASTGVDAPQATAADREPAAATSPIPAADGKANLSQTVDEPQVETGTTAVARAAAGSVDGLDPEWLDTQTKVLLGVVLVTLGIASLVGQYLRRQPTESLNPALVQRFRQRLNSWWLMCAILVFGLLLQPMGTIVLFAFVSFWALREFITMAPTRRGDHRALFWALIVITPLQYVLIGLEHHGMYWPNGRSIDFYGLYSIMIPVYASLLVPARIALSGDHKRFLERSAQITIGLLICVYSLSYAAALVNLRLCSNSGLPWTGSPAGLLFFFILISQLSDILQWTWGHLVGRRIIAAEVSSSRTWEGFAGGTLSTGLIGAALYWVTPFSFWEAACMSMVIGVMGMFGGMTMSAIKRDRGVNDYGSLVMGHAGVLDRIDTLCFAAPVFYHLTRFFFSQ
jgi:phosphatidate cytidylyltransferase